MKHVNGYQTDDGRIFTSPIDAELHEATVILDQCLRDIGVHPARFLDALLRNREPVTRLLDAYKKAEVTQSESNGSLELEVAARQLSSLAEGNTREPDDGFEGRHIEAGFDEIRERQQPRRATVDFSAARIVGTEESAASLLQQPARRPLVLPHMGRGAPTEEVSDDSEVDGIGSGESDARDVRGGEDMAVDLDTETPEAR